MKKKRYFKIVVISNRYKNILDNFIDSSNPNSLLRLINKKLCNKSKSRSNLISFLEENYLDKDILTSDKLSQLTSKIENS